MSETRVATRYAKSLFDLSVEKNILEVIQEDAVAFIKLSNDSRAFDNLLKSPVVSPYKKQVILDKLLTGQVNPMTLSFMHIVLRKKREMLLRNIFGQFIEMYKHSKGILTATVTTAIPLDEALKQDITKLLQQKTNCSIDLKTRVNRDVIGGFVLQYQDKLVDASVASQLKSLRNHLLNNN